MEKKCKRCSSTADYICICQERHLCNKCLLNHIKTSNSITHRPVSLIHPLLTLILSEYPEQEDPSSGETLTEIEKLQVFKTKSISIVDAKIKELLDVQEKNLLRKSVNKTCDTLKITEPELSRFSPALDLRSCNKTPSLKLEELSNSVPITTRSFYNDKHLTYKIVILGDQGVGKTSFVSSFKDMQKIKRSGDSKVTGIVKVEGKNFNIDLWDLSGKDRYKALNKICFSNAAAAVILFDLTQEMSLGSIDKRSECLRNEADILSVVALVGNKVDITVKYPKKRFVSFDKAQKIAGQRGMLYEEISATNPSHINELLRRIVKEIYARKIPSRGNRNSMLTSRY